MLVANRFAEIARAKPENKCGPVTSPHIIKSGPLKQMNARLYTAAPQPIYRYSGPDNRPEPRANKSKRVTQAHMKVS